LGLGDLASNTLLWTELQRKHQLQKELKEKKREVALLQAMASEQDRKVEFAKCAPTARLDVSERCRSADATMATWGGSTQFSAESLHDHAREGQSDSDSLHGVVRHHVGKPSRVRRWPEDQQCLPGKKKKRLQDQESPASKEEAKGEEAITSDFFGTSGGYSAVWPSIIFPSKSVPPEQPKPINPPVSSSDHPAMSRQQEGDFEWEQRCQTLHQQLLQSTTLCNNLLREQLALSQLIQDGRSRPHWYIQEYMQRLQESNALFNQQQQHVTRLQQELSRLYSLKQGNEGQPTTPLTGNVNRQPVMPPYPHPHPYYNSPFPSPWLSPFYPYNPWGSVYPGQYGPFMHPGYPQTQPLPSVHSQSHSFPPVLSQELPSTTEAVYPAGMGDELRSNRTYSVESLPRNTAGDREDHSSTSSLAVDINHRDSQAKATAVASMEALKIVATQEHVSKSLAKKARKAALDEVKGRAKQNIEAAAAESLSKQMDTLSLSSAQSSVPGDGGGDDGDYSLFEALRESIYAEVAALISQNESRPHFLIELFRELQVLSSDYLRQRALYAIQDLVTRYLTADSVQPFSTASANIPDSV
jgi:pericentriolar material 1 protein